MKKINYFMLFAAAAIAFGACSRNDEMEPVLPENGYDYSFNLSVADTRAVLGTKAVEYEAGDKLGVFVGTAAQSEGSVDVDQSPVVVEFKTEAALASGEMIYAYYPYSAANSSASATAVKLNIPVAQNQKAGSYDAEAMPLVALPYTVDAEVAAGKKAGDLYMYNMAAVVEYQVYSTNAAYQSEKVVSVEFETLDSGIAGEFSCNISNVDFETYKTPSLTANTVVTTVKSPMNVGTQAAKAKVYMVVGTGAQTGSVTVNTDVASYTFNMENEVLFERAVVKPLGLNLANAVNRRNHGISCEWYFGGTGNLNAPSAIHPAVDKDGNVYVTETNSAYIHKINANGTLGWKKKMDSTISGQVSSPSVEPDGSIVYAGGGSSSGGAIYAYYTADGTQKWAFTSSEFWNGASDPAPKVNRISPAIGQNSIYVGNGGSTGSAIAINKQTGNRTSYVCSKADGTGGPAGGTNVGMSVSKGGAVLFGASYGIFSADGGLMDNPTSTGAQGGYVPFAAQYRDQNRTAGFNSNIACFTLNGVDHYAYLHGTSAGMNVNWGPISKGSGLASYDTGSSTQNWSTHKIAGTAAQDQGGVAIGIRNEIIVALKHNTTVSGGLYAVDPATNQMAWSFAADDDVAGVPAVDDAGNVHFFTDKTATYYIVKPDYENKTATLLASAKILDLVLAKGGSELDSESAARTWTSAVIGLDGKIYAYAQLGGKGYVVCMSYEGCKGIGDTPWPMKAADCFNSGIQRK